MKLCVEELQASGLVQSMTADRNVNVYAIRPHLYRHLFPTGTLKVQLLDNSNNLLTESATVDIADIDSANYYHGYVKFVLNYGLTKDTTYKIKLVGGGGYTFDEAAYIGWCNSYDLGKYDLSYSPSYSLQYPFDLEIWERKTK